MKLNFQHFVLKNKGAFKIAHGTRLQTDTLIVSFEKDGLIGYGEAAHVPYYGISVEDSLAALTDLAKDSFLTESHDMEEFHEFLKLKLKGNHFAICAVDMAHWDLKAKLEKKNLMSFLGLKNENIPLSSYTIGIGSIEEMVEKVQKTDFPILKIKLGTHEDDKIIENVRKHTNAILRIDANTGWKTSEAIYLSQKMLDNGVEFIEQPFARDAYKEMEQLMHSTEAIYIADESCKFEADVDNCIGSFHGINIKLSKCGGITPALRMIKKARTYNLKVMLGCMTESSIGISALAHLLPLVDYADLDGALLIKNDPGDGVKVVKGITHFLNRNGHGGVLK